MRTIPLIHGNQILLAIQVLAVLAIMSTAALSSHAAMIIPIDDRPVLGRPTYELGLVSNVTAVSGDGSTVIGRLEEGPFRGAFRWTRTGGFTPIGDLWQSVPGGNYSWVNAVSDDGRVVVGSSNTDRLPTGPGTSPGNNYPAYSSPKRVAVRWTDAEGLELLGELPGGSLVSEAHGVTALGDVIVGYANSGAARWTQDGTGTDGSARLIKRGDGFIATDISADGQVIVGNSGAGEAVVWHSQGLTSVWRLPGSTAPNYALAISADGTTVVGYSEALDGSSQAYRWTLEAGMELLGSDPGIAGHTRAVDANGDGSIVLVQGGIGGTQSQIFLWGAESGLKSIDDVLDDYGVDTTGWTFDEAVGISNDGSVIVGNGRYQNRDIGWLIDLTTDTTSENPEPSSALLALLAALFVAVRRANTAAR
jgi:uncharacterized membrane protein